MNQLRDCGMDASTFDGTNSDLYDAYCRFIKNSGKTALKCLPADPALQQWFAERNKPMPYEDFIAALQNLPPDERSSYVQTITGQYSVSRLMQVPLAVIQTCHDQYQRNVIGQHGEGAAS